MNLQSYFSTTRTALLLQRLLLVLVVPIVLTGCVSNKKMIYFQESEQVSLEDSLANFEPAIQPGDFITINVSANDPELAQPFNLFEVGVDNAMPRPLPYLVDHEGSINFPVLGKQQVAGYTTNELSKRIEKALSNYLVSPIVNVRLTNFKISVVGEVKTPGTYTIPNERITIVEALALAGDLTIQGKREAIMLIREQDGKRTFFTVDLTNKELFNAPYYYLAQNDVIYVQPNKARVNAAAQGPSAGIIISSLSIAISLIAILTR